MYQELLLTIAYGSEEDIFNISWMWRYYEELDEITEENRIIAMYLGFIIIFSPEFPKDMATKQGVWSWNSRIEQNEEKYFHQVSMS